MSFAFPQFMVFSLREKMSIKVLLILTLTLFSLVSKAGSFEFPKTNSGEVNLFVLSEDQAQSISLFRNFGSVKSAGGNCYGLDRVNLLLLTRVSFSISEPKDSYSEIYRKLSIAYDENINVVIHGYHDLNHFFREMQENGFDVENPFRKIIERVQESQNMFENLGLMLHWSEQYQTGGRISQSTYFMRMLQHGIPVSISLTDKRGGHAVTVVGMNIDQSSGRTNHFWVKDTNYPKVLSRLKLYSGSSEYWYYEPWDNNIDRELDGSVFVYFDPYDEAELLLFSANFDAHLDFPDDIKTIYQVQISSISSFLVKKTYNFNYQKSMNLLPFEQLLNPKVPVYPYMSE